MYVWTSSQQYVRGVNKTYFHVYAHLSRVDVNVGSTVQPSTQIGLSGNTGNSDTPHLHFQVHTRYGFNDDSGTGYVPVDLTPVKGFKPDLDYPFNAACGVINDPANTPVVIEANEFQYSSQPVSGGYNWSCSTYLPNHTGTCYRAAIPISPQWGLAPLNYSNVHLTPRISYQVWFPTTTNYRVWICGMGGTTDDDSLHVGQNSSLSGSADDITGYSSSTWKWSSVAMDGSDPYLYLTQNYNNIDIYARENGMRIDRILLTKDFTYNPTTAGIRCGAQGL